jgi:hypothetical protein
MRTANSMRRRAIGAAILGAGALLLAACGGNGDGGGGGSSAGSSPAGATGGSPTFSHSTEITNSYLPISKFDRCVFAGNDEGTEVQVVRTNLSRTKTFHYRGETIDALVQKDKETEDGELVEKTFDYFAQSDSGDVYYLGEDVNEYENGKLTGHGGAWLLGKQTDTPGVLMPANPNVGTTFTSEDVPGITHEDDRVVSTRKARNIGGRIYPNVIRVREDTRPPPETEYKLYSRGTGVISEENGVLELVSCK